jgi:NAD(P)-dependent dehydrogenase (short-subunit alcohol dehydrogenase family)
MADVTYDFKGRSVLITGATSGIGRDAALAFAKAGAGVTFTGRRADRGEALAKEITDAGGKAQFVQGDVTDEAHLKDAVGRAVSAFGGLHVALNNAGVEVTGPTVEISADDIDRVMGINVKGVLLSMKHEIPAMLNSGGGSIINVSSIAGLIAMPGTSIYAASKHAVLGATKAAALEVSSSGVRVNAVSPGGIETDMLDRFTGGDTDALVQFHPIGRIGRPEEITAGVLWLASDASSFGTGHSLTIDGAATAI